MNNDHFTAAVDAIISEDPRFERDAYLFVRDALEYTAKRLQKQQPHKLPTECHVSGAQLLDGLRQHALEQYGPMVVTVLDHWRVRSCEDIGHIVFNLIEAREFGKAEGDSIEDFRGGYSFHDAFVKPSRVAQPAPAAPARRRRPDSVPKTV